MEVYKMTYYLFNSLQLYVCGGYNGTEFLDTAECYDPETNHWTVISSMGSGRCGVGVVAYGDLIFAVSMPYIQKCTE